MRTIEWKKDKIRIIDQTKLPGKWVYLNLENVKELWWAIKKLKVRGAPAIGIAAGFEVVLGMRNSRARTFQQFKKELLKVTRYLKRARPTAVNLSWALERMKKKVDAHSRHSVPSLKRLLLQEALKILQEDKDICRKMANFGATLIRNRDAILTHCNAGSLATADYGTALGVIYQAKSQGKKIKVYADETRPVLQGARLTTWELMKHKVDVTLICDNMAGWLMKQGKISAVITGADRIAANGDTANKIGTYSLSILAREHSVPFYIAAPSSTFDMGIKSGAEIPIEQRAAQEVTSFRDVQTAPTDVNVYNPAFDVTESCDITAIITERGVIEKPNRERVAEHLA